MKFKQSKYGQWAYPGENTLIPNVDGKITMQGVGGPVLGIDDEGNSMMMMPGHDYQFPGNSVYEIPMYGNGGPKVKQRRGVRKNYDNKTWTPSGLQFPTSVSSHLMRAEYIPERGWVAFPSLFQDSKPYADDQQNWIDMSEEEDLMKVYEEAERRGEVYDFGEDKEAALAFGEGSWKDQLPDEVIEVELTDKEADKYRAGGYILEEIDEGGEPGPGGPIYVKDKNDPRYQEYLKRKELYEKSKEAFYRDQKDYEKKWATEHPTTGKISKVYFSTNPKNVKDDWSKPTRTKYDEAIKNRYFLAYGDSPSNNPGNLNKWDISKNTLNSDASILDSSDTKVELDGRMKNIYKLAKNYGIKPDFHQTENVGSINVTSNVFFKKPEFEVIVDPSKVPAEEELTFEDMTIPQMETLDPQVIPTNLQNFVYGPIDDNWPEEEGYTRRELRQQEREGKQDDIQQNIKTNRVYNLFGKKKKNRDRKSYRRKWFEEGGYILEELHEGGVPHQHPHSTDPTPSRTPRVYTYKDHKDIIDSTANWETRSDVPISSDYNAQIQDRLYSGNYGFDSKTGQLIKLDKRGRTKVKDPYVKEVKKDLKVMQDMTQDEKLNYQQGKRDDKDWELHKKYIEGKVPHTISTVDAWRPHFQLTDKYGNTFDAYDRPGQEVFMTPAQKDAYIKASVAHNAPIWKEQANNVFGAATAFTPWGAGVWGMYGLANLGLKSAPELVSDPGSLENWKNVGLDLVTASPFVPGSVRAIKRSAPAIKSNTRKLVTAIDDAIPTPAPGSQTFASGIIPDVKRNLKVLKSKLKSKPKSSKPDVKEKLKKGTTQEEFDAFEKSLKPGEYLDEYRVKFDNPAESPIGWSPGMVPGATTPRKLLREVRNFSMGNFPLVNRLPIVRRMSGSPSVVHPDVLKYTPYKSMYNAPIPVGPQGFDTFNRFKDLSSKLKYPVGPITQKEVIALNTKLDDIMGSQTISSRGVKPNKKGFQKAAKQYNRIFGNTKFDVKPGSTNFSRHELNKFLYKGDNKIGDVMPTTERVFMNLAMPTVTGLSGYLAYDSDTGRDIRDWLQNNWQAYGNKLNRVTGLNIVPTDITKAGNIVRNPSSGDTGPTPYDTLIRLDDNVLGYGNIDSAPSKYTTILGGDFVNKSDQNRYTKDNTVRMAQDWTDAIENDPRQQVGDRRSGERPLRVKDIKSYYGVENGKLKLGMPEDFEPGTTIIPNRYDKGQTVAKALNVKDEGVFRIVDSKGKPIYQNSSNFGKIIFTSDEGDPIFVSFDSNPRSRQTAVDQVNQYIETHKNVKPIVLDTGRFAHWMHNPKGLETMQGDTESTGNELYWSTGSMGGSDRGYNIFIEKPRPVRRPRGGGGSWKEGGSVDIELTEKEVAEYLKGGYILEELHVGGEPHNHPHEDEVVIKTDPIYVSDKNDPRLIEYLKRKELYEHSKDAWDHYAVYKKASDMKRLQSKLKRAIDERTGKRKTRYETEEGSVEKYKQAIEDLKNSTWDYDSYMTQFPKAKDYDLGPLRNYRNNKSLTFESPESYTNPLDSYINPMLTLASDNKKFDTWRTFNFKRIKETEGNIYIPSWQKETAEAVKQGFLPDYIIPSMIKHFNYNRLVGKTEPVLHGYYKKPEVEYIFKEAKPKKLLQKDIIKLNNEKNDLQSLEVRGSLNEAQKARLDKIKAMLKSDADYVRDNMEYNQDIKREGGYILEELQDGGYPGGIDRELYQYEEGRKTLDQLSPEAKKIAIANNKKNYENNPDPFAFRKIQFEFDKKQSDKKLKKTKEQSKNLLNTSSSGNKFGLNDKFKFKGFDTRSEEQKRIDEENFQKSVQDSSASTQDGYSLPISLIDGSKEDLANFMYDTPRELTADEKSKALSWISGQPQNKELSNDDIYQLMEGQAKYLNIPKKSDEQIVQEYYNEVAKNPNYLKRNFGKPGPSIHIPYEAMKRLEEKKKKELEGYEVTDASPGPFDDHIEFAKELTINPIQRTYNKLTTDPIGFGKDIGTTYSDLVTSPISAGKELYDYVAGDGNFEFDEIIDMDALGTTLDVVGSVPISSVFTKVLKPVTKFTKPAITKGFSKARKAFKRKPNYYEKVANSEGMVDLNRKLYITDESYNAWLKKFPDYANDKTQVSKMLQKVDSGEIGVLQKKPSKYSVREDELILPPEKFKIVDEQVKIKLDRMKSEKGFKLLKEQEKAYLNKTLNKDGKLTAKELDEMAETAANARIDEVENLYNTKNYSADIEMSAWHRRSPELGNLYDKSGQYVANINKTFSPTNKEVVLGFNPNYVTRKNPAVIQHELGHMASAGRDIPIEKELIEAVGKPNVYKNIPKGQKYNDGAWRAHNYFIKKDEMGEKLVETLRKLDPVENQSLTKSQLFDKYKHYKDANFPYMASDIRINTLKGGEPIPFAHELKETLMQQGLLKDWFDPVTKDMLIQSQKLSKQTPRGYFQKSSWHDGKLDKHGHVQSTTRILDFTDPSRYEQLAKVLNKLAPVVASPVVATSMLDNKRDGGFIDTELTEDEVLDLLQKGYNLEEL